MEKVNPHTKDFGVRVNIPEWLGKTDVASCPYCAIGRGKGFVEKNMEAIASFIQEVLEPEGFANKKALLQAIDPRVKLFSVMLLIVAAAILKNVLLLAGFLAFVAILTFASKISFPVLFKRMMPILIVTFLLVLPTIFNFVTPGAAVVTISQWDALPVYISRQGLEGLGVLLFRVAAMVSLLSLFMLTTNYPDVFRALRSFPIPKIFIAALSMTFRYIMVLMKIAEDSHIAKKARTIKPSTLKQGRGWLASRIWLIMEKSLETADGVYMAMTARGFTGYVKTMTAFEMKARDYAWLGACIFVFLLAIQL